MRTKLGMLAIVAFTSLPALFGSTARADTVTPVSIVSARYDGCFHRGFYRPGWHHRGYSPRFRHYRRW